MTHTVEASASKFIDLFRGRGDVYGGWEGVCIKQPLSPAMFVSHLNGDHLFGVYPSVPTALGAMCVWGCTDIDYDDYSEADLLRNTFAAIGIPAWVEKTRKGWHVWVFAETLVPSEHMRNLQLAAHQVAGTNPKEVNPKQTNVTAKLIGNYVRLPYPGGLQERRMVDSAGETMSLEDFVNEAHATRVAPDLIAEFAGYYIPPPQVHAVVGVASGDMTLAAQSLTRLGFVIWRDGPLEGRDRSTTLLHLCHECFKAALPIEDALMLVKDADSRWGKFSMRGEAGLAEMLKLLRKAYGDTAFT
jgi:hypothetical protein